MSRSCFFLSSDIFSASSTSSASRHSWRIELAKTGVFNGSGRNPMYGLFIRKIGSIDSSSVTLKMSIYNIANDRVLSFKTNSCVVFQDPCLRIGWSNILSQQQLIGEVMVDKTTSLSTSIPAPSPFRDKHVDKNTTTFPTTNLLYQKMMKSRMLTPFTRRSSTEGVTIRCHITFLDESSFDPSDKGFNVLKNLSHDLAILFMDRTFVKLAKHDKKDLCELKFNGDLELHKKRLHRQSLKLHHYFQDKKMQYLRLQNASFDKNTNMLNVFPSVICPAVGNNSTKPKTQDKGRTTFGHNYDPRTTTWPLKRKARSDSSCSFEHKLLVLECILDFSVTGSFKCLVNSQLLLSLHSHSCHYRMTQMKNHVESMLMSSLNDDVIMQAILQSSFYSSPRFFSSCLNYLCYRLENFAKEQALTFTAFRVFANFDSAAHLHPDLMAKVFKKCNKKLVSQRLLKNHQDMKGKTTFLQMPHHDLKKTIVKKESSSQKETCV